MKKHLLFIALMLITCKASAQFTVYQNVPDPPRSSTYSYSNPFDNIDINPYENVRRTPQPRTQQYNLTGYYKDTNGWHSTPIKVKVMGDDMQLVSVKVGNNWASCNSSVSSVGAYDPQEIQENFNYKGYLSFLGTIYF